MFHRTAALEFGVRWSPSLVESVFTISEELYSEIPPAIFSYNFSWMCLEQILYRTFPDGSFCVETNKLVAKQNLKTYQSWYKGLLLVYREWDNSVRYEKVRIPSLIKAVGSIACFDWLCKEGP